MAKPKIFADGQPLTAADINTYLTPEVPNPGDPVDTDWVSEGLSISTGNGWALRSYKVRRIGCGIRGQIALARTGGTITPGATGNIPDEDLCTMPDGWRANSGLNEQLQLNVSGVKTAWGRAQGDGTGLIQVTHAIPGVTIANGEVWVLTLDYTAN